MRSDYPLPHPRLKRPLEWAWEPHPEHGRIVSLRLPARGETSRQLPWTGAVHEGLAAGETVPALVQRVMRAPGIEDDDARARSRLGTYLYQLWVEDLVELDFDESPRTGVPRALHVGRCLGRGGIGVVWEATFDPSARTGPPDDHPSPAPPISDATPAAPSSGSTSLVLEREPVADGVVALKHAWDFFLPLHQAERVIQHELEVLRSLDHPNIIRFYGHFAAAGRTWIVRELVQGAPLAVQRLESPELFRRAREGLDAVAHMHERGWLILDARPANLFVRRRDDRLVLVDVGSAQRHEGIGAENERRLRRSLGSPGFSAPETRKRHRASTASDVYGLGRLWFALATGLVPHKRWEDTHLREKLADHPLAATIHQMCAADPADRPSVEALGELLEQVDPVSS